MKGIIYRNRLLYELAMYALYGRYYSDRYRAMTNLVEANSSVLDICCGPGILYGRYLRAKNISYTGVDLNPVFIKQVIAYGATGAVQDVRMIEAFPGADFVIMQASLYHFLPDAAPILKRMLMAAKKSLIITEPIRNVAYCKSPLIRKLAGLISDAGTGPQMLRFTEHSLDALLRSIVERPMRSFQIAGGREKIYVVSTS